MKEHKIHFTGIGGIGMSALAQLHFSLGAQVGGSDRSPSPVTEMLEKKGITCIIGQTEKNVPEDATLLVYSDAVPEDNPERARARELGIREVSYFTALGEATTQGTSIVISGTHGKTTTTAMIAKVLIDLGLEPTVIAGSILSEYGSNFVKGRDDLFVIEGCEYRRHFLHLHPRVLVINNIELDHTDYYKDLADMQDAFMSVMKLLPDDGVLVTNTKTESITPIVEACKRRIVPFEEMNVPELLVSGVFNKENARAAKSAVYALLREPDEHVVDGSLKTFRGTWRRFEYKGKTEKGALVYDDYAHHPTAVRFTLTAAKEAFPDKKIVVAFHPHLYSRTKSFFVEFAEALSVADEVVLVPIYAAREKLDPTVSSEALVQKIREIGGIAEYAPTFDDAERMLLEKDKRYVIITMGAGDVYQVGDRIV